jgi:hypothetical protein
MANTIASKWPSPNFVVNLSHAQMKANNSIVVNYSSPVNLGGCNCLEGVVLEENSQTIPGLCYGEI